MLTNRQKDIIAASINIISDKGIQGLTIKNLAKSIGNTESAIYRHFESKAQILSSILDGLIEEFNTFFPPLLKTNETSLQKIRNCYLHHIKLFHDNPPITSVMFAEEIFKNDSILADKTLEMLKINDKFFNTIVTKGQEDNEIRKDLSADRIVLMAMGTLRLMLKRWELSHFSFDVLEEGESLCESITLIIST